MAKYSNKYNTTSCYGTYVKVHPFTTTDNEYAYDPGTTWVYVRTFTGFTEQEALDNSSSSGGQWIRCDGAWRPVNTYSSGTTQDDDALVFVRVEVYWPGLPPKAVKYSRMPVLCTYGFSYLKYGNSNYRISPPITNEGVEVWLNGVKKDQYLTYGGAFHTYRLIEQDRAVRNYLTSGVTDNMEIMVSGATTGYPFYNQFLSGTSSSINACIFSAKTSGDKYKTIAEVGWKNYNNYFPPCTTDDTFTYDNCGGEYDETDCPSDDCPTDCDRVCNCDSETYCYYNECQDCDAYACQTQITNQCACFSADLNPECEKDLGIYDSCEYVPLKCIYASKANAANVVVPHLRDLAGPFVHSLKTTKYRLEGKFLRSGGTRYYVAGLSTSISRRANNRNLLTCYGLATGGIIRGDLNITGRTGSFGFSGLTYLTDVDITCSHNTIYNNLDGSLVFSGSTVTSNTESAQSLWFNLYQFSYSRVRVYAEEQEILDLRPVMANCTKGSMVFPTKYGFLDVIHNGFYPIGGDPQTAGIKPCVPIGYENGDLIDTNCVSGNGTDIYWSMGQVVSGVPVSNLRLRFEGRIPYNSSNNMLFATYSGTSTASTYQRVCIRTYGYVSSSRMDTDWRLSYSGSTTHAGISGVSGQSYNSDIDVTFGNRYVYDNKANKYVYSAATQNSASQLQTFLRINFGRLVLYRLRVYNLDTLVADYVPKVVVYNDELWPGVYDTVNDTYGRFTNTGMSFCQIIVEPVTNKFYLKCMNGPQLYYTAQYNSGDTIDKTVIADPVSEGKTFTGWNPAIPDTMPNADFTTYAQYTVNQYTIYYYVDGSLYTQQTYDYGTQISAPTEPTPPSGYIFSGWNIPYTTMPAFDVNIYATMDVYVPKYTINFYSGTTSWGSTPSCSKFKTLQYQQGATISYPSVSGSCRPFAYGGWKLSCTGGTNAPTTMPATEGLNVYAVIGWKVSTIHWMAKTTGTTYTEYETQTAEYQDTISSGPDLSTYAPSGYEWNGWGTEVPFTMPCEDKYVYGQFTDITKIYYTYTLYADGEVFTQRQFEEGDSIPYSGSNSIMNGLPSTSGSCSITWSWPTPDPATMPSNNLSANTYSARDTHTLAYYVDGSLWNSYNVYCGNSLLEHALPNNTGYSYSAWNPSTPSTMPDSNVSCFTQSTHIVYHVKYYKNNSLWATDNYYYGDTITPHALPTDVGKTYSAWSPALPSTMPANDISTYSSSAGTQYQMYYYLYNMSGSTSSTLHTTRTFTYQQTVSGLGAPSSVPTGQSFSGWTGEPSTMPANDVYVSGWTIPIEYTISWYSRDGVSTTLIAADNYYYNNTMLIRVAPGSDWVYTPSLIGSNKMPASDVTAYSDIPTACTSDCSSDVCLCNGIEIICTVEYCTDCAKDFCNAEGQTDVYMTYNLIGNYSDPNSLNIKGIRFKIYLKRNGVTLDTGTHTYTSNGNFTSQSIYETGSLSFPSSYNGTSATLNATISRKNGNAWGAEEVADIYPTTVTLNQNGNIEINAWFVVN